MQTYIELIIGRLVTDEGFRRAFERDPHQALVDAARWGLTLSPVEVSALLATDRSLWDRISRELDVRLQKTSVETEA